MQQTDIDKLKAQVEASNSVVATVMTELEQIEASQKALEDQVATLQANNSSLDFSGLTQAVSDQSAALASLREKADAGVAAIPVATPPTATGTTPVA